MRPIDSIIIHCSATPEGKHFTAADIRRWHKAQGWSDIGYHYVILLDGTVQEGRPIEQPGAHCKGMNDRSIGICYIGGLASDGKTPKDTRTTAQKASMHALVEKLANRYGLTASQIHGHNEYAAKACPSFNVRREVWLLLACCMSILLSACLAMSGCSSAKSVDAERSFRADTHLQADTMAAQSIRNVDASSLLRDTVIVRDTVRQSELLRGDTLRLMTEKVRTVWRFRTVRDTVRIFRTDTLMFIQYTASEARQEEVKEKKPPNGGRSRTSFLFYGLLLALTGAAAITIHFMDKKKKS